MSIWVNSMGSLRRSWARMFVFCWGDVLILLICFRFFLCWSCWALVSMLCALPSDIALNLLPFDRDQHHSWASSIWEDEAYNGGPTKGEMACSQFIPIVSWKKGKKSSLVLFQPIEKQGWFQMHRWWERSAQLIDILQLLFVSSGFFFLTLEMR